MKGRPEAGVVDFVRALVHRRRRQSAAVLAGTLAATAFEGGGLVLLVPLLGVAGLAVEEGSTGVLQETVTTGFRVLGLEPSLMPVLIAFLAVSAARAALTRRVAVMTGELRAGVVADLRREVHGALVAAPWSTVVQLRMSDLEHALTEEADRAGSGVHFALQVMVYALLGFVTLVLAVVLSPALTAMTVAAALLALVVLQRVRGRVEARGAAVSDAMRAGYADLEHHLAGAKISRAFGNTDRERVRFASAVDRIARAEMDLAGEYGSVDWRSTLVTTVALAVVVYVAVAILALPTASLLLLLYLCSRLLGRGAGVHRNLQYLRSVLPSWNRLLDLIRRCSSAVTAVPASEGTSTTLGRTLRLEGVSFDYGRGDGPALRGVDLRLEPGTVTALVGPSGAGKTTLADIVIGLLEPSAGRVLVDGRTREGGPVAPWRSSLGYVPQDPFLFHESVRENLLWARPGATEADLERALRRADALDLVRHLPEGLDTVVGERGASISGGERQRLALARALVRDPDLLVLDEATSNLDAASEGRIRASLEALRGETTMLVVAHRLSTVRGADLIVVLDGGCVVEQGTWDELVSRGGEGVFRSLAAAQGLVRD